MNFKEFSKLKALAKLKVIEKKVKLKSPKKTILKATFLHKSGVLK